LDQIQKAHLYLVSELIKLIKKQRSLMRLNRETGARLNRSGKGALDVPEKLILSEVTSPKVRLRMHETPRSSGRTFVNKSGAQTLSCSCLTQDEHRLR
jgi:hypothetical protein